MVLTGAWSLPCRKERPLGILLGIGGLMLLVAIHEFGHLIVAKLLRFSVLSFSVGLGPKLWSRTIRGTEYSLRSVPLGGLVQIPGGGGAEMDEEERRKWIARGIPEQSLEKSGWFSQKSGWAQIAVLAAGPFANFAMAILLAAMLVARQGIPETVSPLTVETVSLGASEAGILPGDQVLAVAGEKVASADEVISQVSKAEKSVAVLVSRNGRESLYKVDLSSDAPKRMGVVFRSRYRSATILEAISEGTSSTMRAMSSYVSSLWVVFTPKGIAEISGPVGITKIGSDAASKGIDDYLVYLWVMSLVLGVMNLIPFIPVLDGGQIVFALYKVITGREVGTTVRLVAAVFGVVTMLFLFGIGLYNDISRLILHR